MASRAHILVLLAACGGGDLAPNPDGTPGDATSGDSIPGCGLTVSFDPFPAFAFPGSRVTARAMVSNAPGVLTYEWIVTRAGNPVMPLVMEAADGSAVSFSTEIADPYQVMVKVDGTSVPCPQDFFPLNVGVPNANSSQVRVRVFPPSSIGAPPTERFVLVQGGANAIHNITVEPGIVTTGATSAQAYMRFAPVASPDALIETFSTTAGAYSVRLLNQPHDVLVIPLVVGFAPKKFTNWLPNSPLALDAGTAITGRVGDPANANLAGAKVQLTIGGVPTTLTTTDAAGNFTVRASTTTGPATIEVTPPAATGLPKLVASSMTWTLGASVQVRYNAGLASRDLAGSTVRRNGVAQPNAQVTIVGEITNAGTVTAGVTADAIGEVRASAIANGSGVLPQLRAPDELLVAVVSPAIGDFTSSAIDLRGAVPATVDAPPTIPVSTQLRNSTGATLGGAIFEAQPSGVFAMAGVGAIRVVADGAGNVTAGFAPNTAYDLHMHDPRGGEDARKAAPRKAAVANAAAVLGSYALPPAIRISGTVKLASTSQGVGNAAVQVLCAVGTECTGVARSVPLAQGASSSTGGFAVAVTDPGTM
jgi:hypothetical protein